MTRTKSDRYKNWKVVFLWILGAIFAVAASLIAGNTKMTTGTTSAGFILALAISFMFFLIAGILWISVAIAIKELEEK